MTLKKYAVTIFLGNYCFDAVYCMMWWWLVLNEYSLLMFKKEILA